MEGKSDDWGQSIVLDFCLGFKGNRYFYTTSFKQQAAKLLNDSAEVNCTKKVVMRTEIVYDEEIRCKEVDSKECYDVFETKFKKATV